MVYGAFVRPKSLPRPGLRNGRRILTTFTPPDMSTAAAPDPYGAMLYCDALTAYRRDLDRTPDVVRFGADDAGWLRRTVQLERLTAAAPARVRAGSALATQPALRPAPLLAVAERMESAGALILAFTALSAARRVWDSADPASAGIAIFRQARISRTLGAKQSAENFYSFLYAFATRHRLPELRGRALVGKGIIRTLEGDAAAAYRWYAKARIACGRHPAAVAVSYHGEMAAALSAGDFSRALVAGWHALSTGALLRHDEAGLMVNMASIALRADQPQSALRAVRVALRASNHARVRLTAYSKGALAAAQLGQRTLLERYAARVVATAATASFPLEELESRSELAVAFALVGDTAKARRLASAARRDALPLGLGTIVRRCDALLAGHAAAEPAVALSAPAQRVVRQLEMV